MYFRKRIFVWIENLSISNFISTLNEGTIIVKSNGLSPLSVFEIHLPTPNSILELYSVKAVISYRYNILHIALYEGNISLKTNDSTKYINAPSYYVSDDYNLANSIKNHDANLSETPTRWNAFKDYISVENDSVIFFPSTSSSESAAEAIIIRLIFIIKALADHDHLKTLNFKTNGLKIFAD